MYIYMYVYIYIYIICVHIYMYVHVYFMYIYAYAYILIYLHTHKDVRICIYSYICISTYLQIDTHWHVDAPLLIRIFTCPIKFDVSLYMTANLSFFCRWAIEIFFCKTPLCAKTRTITWCALWWMKKDSR